MRGLGCLVGALGGGLVGYFALGIVSGATCCIIGLVLGIIRPPKKKGVIVGGATEAIGGLISAFFSPYLGIAFVGGFLAGFLIVYIIAVLAGLFLIGCAATALE